jgi:hypothetical protein
MFVGDDSYPERESDSESECPESLEIDYPDDDDGDEIAYDDREYLMSPSIEDYAIRPTPSKSKQPTVIVRELTGACAICLDQKLLQQALVYCANVCGQVFHHVCIRLYTQHSQKDTCPLCTVSTTFAPIIRPESTNSFSRQATALK